jgi:hypothetical protein
MLVRGKRLEARAEEIEEALRDARDATERLDRLHQQIYGRVHESELATLDTMADMHDEQDNRAAPKES